MFKPLVAATCALALGAGATVVFAQDPSTPPTVTVGVGKSQVTLQGADGVKGGPTRFVFTNSDKVKETFGGIFALKSGTTVEDFKRETARGLNHVWGMGSVEASATLEGASDQRVVTADLQPGGSYIAFQAQSEDPKKWVLGLIFPLIARAVGVLASIVGIFAVRAREGETNALKPINQELNRLWGPHDHTPGEEVVQRYLRQRYDELLKLEQPHA